MIFLFSQKRFFSNGRESLGTIKNFFSNETTAQYLPDTNQIKMSLAHLKQTESALDVL